MLLLIAQDITQQQSLLPSMTPHNIQSEEPTQDNRLYTFSPAFEVTLQTEQVRSASSIMFQDQPISSTLVSPEEKIALMDLKQVPFGSTPSLASGVSRARQTPSANQQVDPSNPLLKTARPLPKSESPALNNEAEELKHSEDDDVSPPPLYRKETRRNALTSSSEKCDDDK